MSSWIISHTQGSHSKLYWFFKQGGVSDIKTKRYNSIWLLHFSPQVISFKWLYLFLISVYPSDSMSARLCGCYLILPFMCNDLKSFYILMPLWGLTCHYTIYLRYVLCSVSADVLLNMWLSDNTLSFHFTYQHICLFVINAECFVGSYSATHSSFYRPFLRNNKISHDSSYLSWNIFLNVTMKSCKCSLSVYG